MTPVEATLAALLALPVYKDDVTDHRKPAQYAALAHEVAQLKPPAGVGAKDWRALVLAVGAAETHFALRIMEGQCKPFECDRGRARSSWQLHSNQHTAPVWEQLHGFVTLSVQVRTADAMLKRAYYQCRTTPSDIWIRPVVNAFAGRGCKSNTIAPWRGIDLRLDYWLRARRAMG